MKSLTYREKQLMSLRLAYTGGYTEPFRTGVHRLLRMGVSAEEMEAACKDSTMREWLAAAIKSAPKGA